MSETPKAKMPGTLRERTINVISKQMGVEPANITDETRFREDLKADSLDIVDIVLTLEDEFDIEIPDELAEKITTVGTAIKHIEDLIIAK